MSDKGRDFPIFFYTHAKDAGRPDDPTGATEGVALHLNYSLPYPTHPRHFTHAFYLPPSIYFLFVRTGARGSPTRNLLYQILRVLSTWLRGVRGPFRTTSKNKYLRRRQLCQLNYENELQLYALFVVSRLFRLIGTITTFQYHDEFQLEDFYLFYDKDHFRFHEF